MFHLFKIIIVFLFFVFLNGCASTPSNPERWMEEQKNACLPTAIAFKKGLERRGVWSDVLRYEFTDKNTGRRSGHAIAVYLYPPGKNQLWSYDYMGSYRVRAFKDNPIQIARESVFVRGNWNHEVSFAEYIR